MRYHPHNRHFLVFGQQDREEMSLRAAKRLQHKVRERPDLLLRAATGNSPTRTYELFARSWQGHAATGQLRMKPHAVRRRPPVTGTASSRMRRIPGLEPPARAAAPRQQRYLTRSAHRACVRWIML